MWQCKTSEHYEFHYKKDSTAEKEIDKIIKLQEASFDHITKVLGTIPKEKLVYKLLESPEEVGKCYGDNEPCNGFTRMPNEIYAVYSSDLKCVGHHEDAHMISYMTLNRPNYNFIREGLAMFFDEKWLGISNDHWVKYYSDEGQLPGLEGLLDNLEFHKTGEMVTYPLSGAFTGFLIEKYGIEKYKNFYKAIKDHIIFEFKMHFSKSIKDLEKEFLSSLESLDYHDDTKYLIESLI
jgi:hypothetical protein